MMKQTLFLAAAAALLFSSQVECLAPSSKSLTKGSPAENIQSISRRNVFGLAISSAMMLGITKDDEALAFANKISTQYDDRPKRRGPQVCLLVYAHAF
jgi:hypothetical protein